MSLLPIFVKLEGRLVIVVGGGVIAEAKIPALLHAGARVRVIAPEITKTIARWEQEARLDRRAKAFEPGDLDGASLVIAATSAPGVNEAVYREADRLGVLCNAVDDIEHCHFYYGSIVQRGDLQIAISTNGKSPALAQRLRQELEARFGPEYGPWLERLGAERERIRTNGGDTESSGLLLHQLASEVSFEQFLNTADRGALPQSEAVARTGKGSA
jgi:siroheme synthase-like protein